MRKLQNVRKRVDSPCLDAAECLPKHPNAMTPRTSLHPPTKDVPAVTQRNLLSRIFSLAMLCALGFGHANAQDMQPVQKLVGQAYDKDSGELLYTEVHQFRYDADNRPVADEVEYTSPDGVRLGGKSVDFQQSLYVPSFATELDNSGYVEGLRRQGDGLELYRQKPGEDQAQTSQLDSSRCEAADAGFHPYVQANFDTLLQGDPVSFRFCVVSSLRSVKFKAERLDDGEIEGVRTVRIKVSVASLLGLFVDPLILSYNPANKDLIEYIGISNVRDAKGKAYQIRMRYPIRQAQAQTANDRLSVKEPQSPPQS
jgi:hypothetical protein